MLGLGPGGGTGDTEDRRCGTPKQTCHHSRLHAIRLNGSEARPFRGTKIGPFTRDATKSHCDPSSEARAWWQTKGTSHTPVQLSCFGLSFLRLLIGAVTWARLGYLHEPLVFNPGSVHTDHRPQLWIFGSCQ